MTITPPNGVTGLLITKLVGSEYISRMFRFRLDLLGPVGTPIAFDQMLGQSVTVGVPIPDGGTRYFNGIISRFRRGETVTTTGASYIRYQAMMVPKLWQLSRRKRCWAYQNVTVPNVVTSMLGGVYWSSSVTGTFPTLQYCVQYRETNLAFISRLMEQEGIFYYFVPQNGNHQMILGNSPAANQTVASPSTVSFASTMGVPDATGTIYGWKFSEGVAPVSYTLWDYSFETAGTNLGTSPAQTLPATVNVGQMTVKLNLPSAASLTMYNYPGFYAWQYDNITAQGGSGSDTTSDMKAAANRYAKLWMQRLAVANMRARGQSSCPQFVPGCQFTVDSSGGDWAGTWLLTRVRHLANQTGVYLGQGSGYTYNNSFTCIPSDAANLPYVPPRRTPRPVVRSIQTAMVVGTSGQDITTDPNARVKVQFFWNQMGANNLNAQSGSVPPNLAYWPGTGTYPATNSCWVRVAQGWAGRNWGQIQIPRLGQEVVVAFLEGDPNQPLIVGGVYNSTNQVPFALPDSGMTSGVKTNSLGQPSSNFNGIAFNDTPGQENCQLYGQRLTILNSGGDMVQNVGGNYFQSITGTTMRLGGSLPAFGGTGSVTGSDSKPSSGNSWSSWKMDGVTAGVGADLQVIFGEYCKAVMGLYASVVVGNKVDLIINPFSFLPAALGQFIQGVLPALGGRNEIVLGPKVEFVYNIKSGILMQGEAKINLYRMAVVADPSIANPQILPTDPAVVAYNAYLTKVAAYQLIQKLCLALAIVTSLEFVAIASLGPLSTGDWGVAGQVVADLVMSVGGVALVVLFLIIYYKLLQLIKLESVFGQVAQDLAQAAGPTNAYMAQKWTAFTDWCAANKDGLAAGAAIGTFLAAGVIAGAVAGTGS